ncbi:hypothetical protein BU16DRAFT_579910 [Lophium mytilinum]|uniref:C2H2-type domain-containing protein n=1 Tax=Lophium mytilinum TaxID=390894 RepID=A0A6A6R5X0_9PEZI|nr:hypothetical protein BU16DRAFT_579910 [Lophium mytilinum]
MFWSLSSSTSRLLSSMFFSCDSQLGRSRLAMASSTEPIDLTTERNLEPALLEVIGSAKAATLRQILIKVCMKSEVGSSLVREAILVPEDVDTTATASSATKKRKLDKPVARFAHCVQCEKDFDVTLNVQPGQERTCRRHDGTAECWNWMETRFQMMTILTMAMFLTSTLTGESVHFHSTSRGPAVSRRVGKQLSVCAVDTPFHILAKVRVLCIIGLDWGDIRLKITDGMRDEKEYKASLIWGYYVTRPDASFVYFDIIPLHNTPPPIDHSKYQSITFKMAAGPELIDAISSAQVSTLRSVLFHLCKDSSTASKVEQVLLVSSNELQNDAVKASMATNSKKRKHDDKISRFACCVNCKKDFDVVLNEKPGEEQACGYHDGSLEIDTDFFADDDEVAQDPYSIDVDTDWRVKEYPEGFQWSCCEQDGREAKPCVRCRHSQTVFNHESGGSLWYLGKDGTYTVDDNRNDGDGSDEE